MPAKLTECLAQERARGNIANKCDEVARARIEKTEPGRGIMLRAGLIRVIANGFETNHRLDAIAAFATAAGVDIAAHLRCLEVMRLFVNESDEAKGSGVMRTGRASGEGEKRGDPAAVIVRA